MKNRYRYTARALIRGSIFSALLFSSGLMVHEADAETFPITLACAPDFAPESAQSGQFSMASGRPLTIVCTAHNPGATAIAGFLLGKQTNAENKTDASSSDMTIGANASAETTLKFPALFQSGTYRYLFTLYEAKTHQVIAQAAALSGTISGGEKSRILSATLDQTTYEWQAPATLSFAVAVPKEQTMETASLSLTVSMENVDGKLCQTLIKKTAVQQASDTYAFNFPAADLSCNNALTITLQDGSGATLDEKTVAVALPEISRVTAAATAAIATSSAQAATQPARSLVIALVSLGVVLLILGGFFFMRRKR